MLSVQLISKFRPDLRRKKKIVKESVLKVRSFMRIIGKNGGWKMVYDFLCKDEKTRRNIYLLLDKTYVWKEVRHFSVQCIQAKTT